MLPGRLLAQVNTARMEPDDVSAALVAHSEHDLRRPCDHLDPYGQGVVGPAVALDEGGPGRAGTLEHRISALVHQ